MSEKRSSFKKQLMLEEITFYSICSEEDQEKIVGHKEMSFEDFRRLSLITDYLKLTHLHQFIWDMYSHNFTVEIEKLYQKCEKQTQDIPDMVLETGRWLDDFWQHAPNQTVSFLLREIFSDGLEKGNN